MMQILALTTADVCVHRGVGMPVFSVQKHSAAAQADVMITNTPVTMPSQAILFRWFWCCLILLPFQIDLSIYSPEIYVSGKFLVYQHFLVYISEIFLLISLIFLGIGLIYKKDKIKLNYGNYPIFIMILLFFIAGEISIIFSIDKIHSFLWVTRLFILGLMYFVIVNNFVSTKRIFVPHFFLKFLYWK